MISTKDLKSKTVMSGLPEMDKPAPADLATRSDSISYVLDSAGTIVSVSGNWDGFARENDGIEILSDKIIGKKLEQFIVGDDTRMFVRTMIMSARTLKRPIYRPYRCDSPKLKRFMEMTLEPRADDTLEVMHRELHSEPIFNAVRMTAAPAGAGWGFLKRCSLCNRVQAQGIWSEIDDAIEANRLQINAASLKVIYGVCPDCLARRGVPL